ncbi:MAG: alanine racemase [Chloroflexota bacterium]
MDLDALVGNLATIREIAGPGVRVEPVVKADAYGHGAVPVARALEDAGADGFGVATVEEALELREGGVRRPILVLYPIAAELAPDAARHGIAVTVGVGSLLDELLAVLAERRPDRFGRRPLEVHLEVDTGLGRGGAMPSQVQAAVARLRAAPGLRLAGIWSHLAAPDDPARTHEQAARFDDAIALVGSDGEVIRHLAATGGLLDGLVAPYDAVRPGLATYGIVPEGMPLPEALRGAAARLRPVMSLVARPVRVAALPAGHGVSYGPSFVTGRESRIATLPVGYGDGWARSLSDNADALVRGRRVPLVGRVAMDAVIADVTDVPGPPVDEADEFVLLGRQGDEEITAAELAQRRTTISWEVVTGMARRLTRVYHAAGVPGAVRTLKGGRTAWRGSNSGTATSASSRSTRS